MIFSHLLFTEIEDDDDVDFCAAVWVENIEIDDWESES